jgi:tricorn protease
VERHSRRQIQELEMNSRPPALALFGIACALAVLAPPARAQTKLLRYPDIHGDRVVFCYAGDLWLAPATGGTANRLTAHPGIELFPKFSPDGKWIAFTGQYDGDEQVYIVPVEGGAPKQLTFYPARGPLAPRWGSDNQVYGWTQDGTTVLFRSMMDNWNQAETRLYTVAITGGLPRALPMPVSGAGDFSPDGKQVVYNPTARDFRTWKRYAGGWQQDLYIFDLETSDSKRITDWPRTERDPMWIDGVIYFDSDRDGTLNICAYDVASGETRQLTQEKTYDVRWPSDDESGRIVYEVGGELWVLDVHTGRTGKIAIAVPNDGVAMRPRRVEVSDAVEDFELAPKAERALFVARGDIFTVPIENGPTRNLTNTSTAHERWARWSPDGTKIAFVSDQSGEDEIWLVNQDGSGEPERLTRDGTCMRYAPEWAPGGERIAFADKDGKLFVLTLDGRRVQQIADDRHGQIHDYVWSPGGSYLAFSMSDDNEFRSIWIWSAEGGALQRVTGPMWNEENPAWDPKGDYLYYTSEREYAPQISSLEWNFATDRMTGIFAVALRKDVKHPFPPESDEIGAEKTDGKAGDADKAADSKEKKGKKGSTKSDAKSADKEKPPSDKKIDFDGLAERVARVPIDADDYTGLAAIEGHLIYVKTWAPFYGRDPAGKSELRIFDLEKRKETTLVEGSRGYALSRDGSKVLVREGSTYKLYDASPKGKDSAKSVSVQGMASDIVPAQEWATIFDEVWRRFRDFFYVDNMHGYDWKALGDQYRALLPYVAHRTDLNYVIGEMIAELNVSHAYIVGGDYDTPPRAPVALPGARFELDSKAGRYRIARIFRGQNEEERYRSPLTELGVDAREGDYVVAIDGEELRPDDSPYRLLRYKADRPVTLTLNTRPTQEGARQVTFDPISSEVSLLYLDWTTHNRERVAAATNGQVGYLHLPDMGSNGIREFIKNYYGQIRRQGLVVDVRSNGGGNVSQMIIERLRRELLGIRFSRLDPDARTYPSTVLYGPMVCLLDENSSSDGDIFPYMFRQAKLGPLIGKRSWGGVIGITNHGPLLDGGTVNVSEFGTNGVDGSWVIEGHGVEPDIEVENDPKSVLAGKDPQLERGIAEVERLMGEVPHELPKRPPPPVRNKAALQR